jgi:hypothetical protein
LLKVSEVHFGKGCEIVNFYLFIKFIDKSMGILEKIKDIEEEVNRTQKNKATEYHLGNLKARLAKLRTELLEPTGKSGGKGEG